MVGVGLSPLCRVAQALFVVDGETAFFHFLESAQRDGVIDLAIEVDDRPATAGEELGERAAFEEVGLASPVFRGRDPKQSEFHFFSVGNLESERNFRQALAALRKSFETPQTLDGVTVDLERAVTTKKIPRSLLGRVRGNSIVPGTWPDYKLGGVLTRGGRRFLHKQADAVAASLNASYPEPVITSSGSISSRAKQPLRYRIEANLKPRSFSATELPAGLALDKKTGLISGKPTRPGPYHVRITAKTNAGPAQRVLKIQIKP